MCEGMNDILSMRSSRETADSAFKTARLIAALPEMYWLISSLATLPDEECIIGPLVNKARGLKELIDGKECKEWRSGA